MTSVIDVSGRLGEYMLRGWVLTDKICTKCTQVPLMKSPSSAAVETHFCVNCNSSPSSANATSPRPSTKSTSLVLDAQSTSSASNSSALSRSSTPPTEVSNAPSSPTFAPLLDTAELLRRRHQSDTASAEIGNRMLKGWAMLADECPGPDCYGIPLVRPPKNGATIDPRKECVICGIVYVDEKDVFGQDRLQPMQPSPSPAQTDRAQGPIVAQPSLSRGKEGAESGIFPQPKPAATHQKEQENATAAPDLSTSAALGASARSLEHSLLVLSEHLDRHTAGPVIDPTSIGETANAISKTSRALTQVKRLLYSESRAFFG